MERKNTMTEEVKNTAETNEDVADTAADGQSTEQAEQTTAPVESESQNTPEAKEQSPVQTKEKNAEYARARREREQAQAIEKARMTAAEEERVKSVIEFVKTNPYTEKPITNAEEVKQYLRMKAISDKGGDPVKDYADEIDREQKEKSKKEAEKAEYQQKIVSDVNDFRKEHPDLNLNEMLQNDKLFQALLIGNEGKSLNDVYNEYDAIISGITKNVEKKLTSEAAKNQSGVGSVQTNGSANPGITKTQFRKMSVDERSKLYEENRALYESLTK